MPSTLVIVESPAKCAKIGGFLGADYVVIATMGHIRALEEDLDAVGIDRDFEPKYRFLTKEKARAINGLKGAMVGCNKVILAADDDREGEAIAYSACLLLKQNPVTVERAVFHEITRAAVCGAVAAPRKLDMNKVWAQQSRAVLDMMVGFTISPLLWKHVGSGLSAGRCQTPALRLTCEREEEIRNFQAASSWRISGTWLVVSSVTAMSRGIVNTPFEASLTDELEDEESALNYLENHNGSREAAEATVKSAETRPWSESAPIAFITSTLQQQASAQFRSGPKATMQSAQRLYEEGHITYMRTDSATMSEEAVDAARKQVEALFGLEYIGSAAAAEAQPKEKKKVGRPSKKAEAGPKAQEAHEAIRPTHFELRELADDRDWNFLDRRLYKLIWTRAMQSVMADAKGEKRTVKFVAAGDESDGTDGFEWEATWRRTTFDGWQKAGKTVVAIEEGTTESSPSSSLPSPPLLLTQTQWDSAAALVPGQQLIWQTLEAHPHTTKAPPRFNEATLVRELEKRGIGRPSTFAMLVETIQEKKYVEKKNIEGHEIIQKCYKLSTHGEAPVASSVPVKMGAEKDKLVPTGLGASVIEFALKHFPDLFDYPFTASMESRLDKIAGGQEQWKKVLHDTWNSYKERYSTLKNAKSCSSSEGNDEHKRDLGNGLFAIKTRKGPLLLRESSSSLNKDDAKFYGWPSGVAFGALTSQEAEAFIASLVRVLGDHEGESVEIREGRYGKYCAWKDVNIPYKDGDTLAEVIAKIGVKIDSAASSRKVGAFEIRNGPYGPYMFKTDAVKKNFVSVPTGIDIATLTPAAATAIFQAGLEAKARSQKYKSVRGSDSGQKWKKKENK